MEIRPGTTQLFHADRRTYRQTKVRKEIAPFRNYANVPKMGRNEIGF